MNPHRRSALSSSRRQQRGISMAVSLILLVVTMLVAVGSMRGVVLQTRMAGTTHDRNLAFQAAEAALREAETRAATATSASFPSSQCNAGFCTQPVLTDTARWQDPAFNQWRASTATVSANAPASEAIVEDKGTAPAWLKCDQDSSAPPNCLTPRYQVTARSMADGRASVQVQSQYAP